MQRRFKLGSTAILLLALCAGCHEGAKPVTRDEAILTGKERPRQIPPEWKGEPLPGDQGWRWFDPKDRGNSVRIHRGDPNAENPVDRDTYVVLTVKGEILDAKGKPTGKFLRD